MMSKNVLLRRELLIGLSASCAIGSVSSWAQAGAAVPVSLSEMVHLSGLVLVGTPIEATGQWEKHGASRRIVTYTKVEVNQPVDGRSPPDSLLYVRTLGGRTGDIGQIVHGEAELQLRLPSVLFLQDLSDGVFTVTSMAQGHYELKTDDRGTNRLLPSPKLADFVRRDPMCAVSRLRGKTIAACEQMVLEELVSGR